MRTIMASPADIDGLTDRGVLLIGDAVHAMPILGGEGANTAIKDGVDLAEHIALHESRGIKSFSATRYDAWRKAVEESETGLAEMHSPRTSSSEE